VSSAAAEVVIADAALLEVTRTRYVLIGLRYSAGTVRVR